jgi:hypothetical protein
MMLMARKMICWVRMLRISFVVLLGFFLFAIQAPPARGIGSSIVVLGGEAPQDNNRRTVVPNLFNLNDLSVTGLVPG